MVECACFDPAGDYGEYGCSEDFYHAKTPKARKTHKCDECDGEIKSGDVYERATGKEEREFYTYKTCGDCLSIAKAFFCSRMHGGLFVDLEEYLRDYDPKDDCYAEAILKLTDRAREMVQEVFDRVVVLEEEELDDGKAR